MIMLCLSVFNMLIYLSILLHIQVWPLLLCQENPNCLLVVTSKGGHLGWVAGDEAPLGAPWTDPLVIDFLQFLETEEAAKSTQTCSNPGDNKETLYHLQV